MLHNPQMTPFFYPSCKFKGVSPINGEHTKRFIKENQESRDNYSKQYDLSILQRERLFYFKVKCCRNTKNYYTPPVSRRLRLLRFTVSEPAWDWSGTDSSLPWLSPESSWGWSPARTDSSLASSLSEISWDWSLAGTDSSSSSLAPSSFRERKMMLQIK